MKCTQDFSSIPLSIAFIDDTLDDLATLHATLSKDVCVHLLSHEKNILSQISDVMSELAEINSIHIFTHGNSGEIKLGSNGLSLETLPMYGAELMTMSSAMTNDGEIYLYGCEVAFGKRGTAFVKMLGDITGLKVAAATHKMGHAELGGSWELDAKPSVMENALHVSEWRGVLALANTSPVLDNTKSPTLGTTLKNLGTPTGSSTANSILVSDLINTTPLANYSDADSDPSGIAITGVNSNGTLWFSTNGGTSWTELTGTVSGTSALMLYANADTRIYFQPDTDYTGDLSDAITFKAWDQNGGYTNGQMGASFGGPTLATTIMPDPVAYTMGVTISGNYAYVGDYGAGLKIYDITNPLSATLVATVDTDGAAHGIAVSGNYIHVADYNNGSDIIDISTPASANAIAQTGAWAFDVAVSGTKLLGISKTDGLYVVNITTPASPTDIGRADPDSYNYYGVAVSGNYAYLPVGPNGLKVINYTEVHSNAYGIYSGDTVTPGVTISNGTSLFGIAISGNYAYAVGTTGLYIYDISGTATSTPPTLVGGTVLDVFTGAADTRMSVAINGNYAYVTDSTAGLHIIDISNPLAPTHIATYDSDGIAQDVAVSGSYAYLADDLNGGLKVIDISNLLPSDAISTDSDTASISVVAPSLAYSATTFEEASANNGSITDKITVTLTGDTFTGTNDAALAGVTVNNVPTGLTAVVTKKTDTTAEISFTGNATAHANANDIANLEVVFGDGAFTGGSAAAVSNATKSDLVIDFDVPVDTLFELDLSDAQQWYRPSPDNDAAGGDASFGLFDSVAAQSATLFNYAYSKFSPTVTGTYDFKLTSTALEDSMIFIYGSDFEVVEGVPSGTFIIGDDDSGDDFSFNNNTTEQLWSGLNDITLTAGETYYFVMSSYEAGDSGAVTFTVTGAGGLNITGGTFAKQLSYSATTFAEAAANDGSIATSVTITLTGDTFTGSDGDSLGTVTNVPAGLTASLVRASDTTATLTLSGNASAHANANDITNLTVTFANDDFTGNNASAVFDSAKSNLVVDFTDPAAPASSGGSSTPVEPAPTPVDPEPTPEEPTPPPVVTETVDGATVETSTKTKTRTTIDADGNTVTKTVTTESLIITPVTDNRADTTGTAETADIPLFWGESSRTEWATTASLPVGIGLTTDGSRAPKENATLADAIDDLIYYIDTTVDESDPDKANQKNGGSTFLQKLENMTDTLVVNKVVLSVDANITTIAKPITISGSANIVATSQSKLAPMEAIVIDASTLPANSQLNLKNVEFAVVVGENLTIRGGDGANILFAGAGSQNIVLGEDDDELYAGAGDDIIGSVSGNDAVYGEAGDDIVFGGAGNDILSGGTGSDIINGGLGYDRAIQEGSKADYSVLVKNGTITLTNSINGSVDKLIDINQIEFENGDIFYIANNKVQEKILLTMGHSKADILYVPITQTKAGTSSNDIFVLSADSFGLSIDGLAGHDILKIDGNENDFKIEDTANGIEVTSLIDGSMVELINFESIQFDNATDGINVVIVGINDNNLI